ncbi:mCG1038841, partial [Mus musculus]
DPGCIRAPGSQAAFGILRSWCDQVPGVLGWCDPGCVRATGNGAASGYCGAGCGVCAQGLLRAPAQTDWKEPVPLLWWNSCMPGSYWT